MAKSQPEDTRSPIPGNAPPFGRDDFQIIVYGEERGPEVGVDNPSGMRSGIFGVENIIPVNRMTKNVVTKGPWRSPDLTPLHQGPVTHSSFSWNLQFTIFASGWLTVSSKLLSGCILTKVYESRFICTSIVKVTPQSGSSCSVLVTVLRPMFVCENV